MKLASVAKNIFWCHLEKDAHSRIMQWTREDGWLYVDGVAETRKVIPERRARALEWARAKWSAAFVVTRAWR